MVETTNSNSDNTKVNLILDAAQKRFSYFGLVKTTMTEIAADVGLSKASLYYYFSDKEALFRAVVKREQDAFVSDMESMIQKKGTYEGKLRIYVKCRFEYFLKVFRHMGQIQMTFETVKPLLADLLESFHKSEVKIVAQIFNKGIENSEFTLDNLHKHADAFVAMISGIRSFTIKMKDTHQMGESDFEEIENRISILCDVFIKGILKR